MSSTIDTLGVDCGNRETLASSSSAGSVRPKHSSKFPNRGSCIRSKCASREIAFTSVRNGVHGVSERSDAFHLGSLVGVRNPNEYLHNIHRSVWTCLLQGRITVVAPAVAFSSAWRSSVARAVSVSVGVPSVRDFR